MSAIALLILCLFIAIDLRFLRRQSRSGYIEAFRYDRWPVVLYLWIFVLAFIFKWLDLNSVAYLVCFILPLYFFQRSYFKIKLTPPQRDPQQLGLQLALGLDACGIVLFWLIGMFLIALVSEGIFMLWPAIESEMAEMVVLSVSSSALMLGLIFRRVRKLSSISLWDVLGLRKHGTPWFSLVILPFIAGIGFAGLSVWLLTSRAVQPSTPMNELIETTTSSWVLMMFLGVALFLAPLVEELIFRGYFFYVIERVRSKLFAIISIAFVFGLMHFEQYWGDPVAIVMVSILGVVLTLFRAFTRSAIPGIIMHYVYNGAMTIIPAVMFIMTYPSYYEFQTRFHELELNQKRELLNKAIQTHPDFAAPYNDLAWIYAENGIQLDEALNLIEQALALDPDNFAFLDTKAEVLFKLGRIQEAIELATHLVDNYPANAYSKKQLKKFKKAYHP